MGTLMRQYWMPALLSSELKSEGATCPPWQRLMRVPSALTTVGNARTTLPTGQSGEGSQWISEDLI